MAFQIFMLAHIHKLILTIIKEVSLQHSKVNLEIHDVSIMSKMLRIMTVKDMDLNKTCLQTTLRLRENFRILRKNVRTKRQDKGLLMPFS